MNPKNNWSFTSLCIGIVLSTLGQASAQSETTNHFLVIKLGDAAAVQEAAVEYLDAVANYLRSNVKSLSERPLHGWIANRVDSAAAIVKRHKPVLAFVPTGFYLQHLRHLQAKPIVETPRFGTAIERYYLVTAKHGPSGLADLKGKSISCAFAIDLPYLSKVVFPDDFQPEVDFRLQPSDNLADDMFLLIEPGASNQSQPAAILMDEELKAFFEKDNLVWPELKIVWQSQDLPRELFVAIGAQWTERASQELFHALLNMKDDPVGSELLNLLQSSGFTEINNRILEKTANQYFSAKP